MTKAVITIVLISLYILGVKIGYSEDSSLSEHLLFAFCHANIFHLLCNLLALWTIKAKAYHFAFGYFVSLIVSFVVAYKEPTYGFSGVLIAAIGMMWAEYFVRTVTSSLLYLDYYSLQKNSMRFIFYTVIPIVLSAFIPNINFPLHGLCFAVALITPFIFAYVKGK